MKISIVVVEDEAEWRKELCRLYQEVFRKHAPRLQVEIESFGSGPDALDRIRKASSCNRISVLSCDINLSSEHPKTQTGRPDLSIEGADGRVVLRKASEGNAAACVVVPTGIVSDATLDAILPGEAQSVRLTLAAYLERLYPGRHLRMDKTSWGEPSSTVDVWIESYGKAIVELSEAWPKIRAPYTLNCSGGGRGVTYLAWTCGRLGEVAREDRLGSQTHKMRGFST